MGNPHDDATKYFLAHYEFVLSRAYSYAPFPGMAQDIVQDVYIDFVKKFETFELEEGKIRPLLTGMVRIAALRLRDKYIREQPSNLIRLAEKFFLHRMQNESADEEEKPKLDALSECISKLPEKNRNMISMHYFQGTKMSQIALEFSMSDNTIRQIFCRIREKLRKCIEETLKKQD